MGNQDSVKCLLVFGSNRYRILIPALDSGKSTLRALKEAVASTYSGTLPPALVDRDKSIFEVYDPDFKEYVHLDDESEIHHLATVRVTRLSENAIEPVVDDSCSESSGSVRNHNGCEDESGDESDDECDADSDVTPRPGSQADSRPPLGSNARSVDAQPPVEGLRGTAPAGPMEIRSINDSALSLQTVTSADHRNGTTFHDVQLKQLEVTHKAEKMILVKLIRDFAKRFWDRDLTVWTEIANIVCSKTKSYWNEEKCKGHFLHMINQYIFLLKRCRNMSDNQVLRIWPFYHIFHYEIDLELHCPITVARILLLKDQFTLSQSAKLHVILDVIAQNQELFKGKRGEAWEQIVGLLFEQNLLHSYEYNKILNALRRRLISLKQEYMCVLNESHTLEEAKTWVFFDRFHHHLNLRLLFHPNDQVIALRDKFNKRISAKLSGASISKKERASTTSLATAHMSNTPDEAISKTRKQKIALIHCVSNRLAEVASVESESSFWQLIAEDMEEFLPETTDSSRMIWETLFLQLYQRYLDIKKLNMTETHKAEAWFYYKFFCLNDFTPFLQRFPRRFKV